MTRLRAARFGFLVVFLVLCLGVAAVAWRLRYRISSKAHRVLAKLGIEDPFTKKKAPPGPPGTFDYRAHPPGPHPRILLTPARLSILQARKAEGAASWTDLLKACDKARASDIRSGYEAWDWVHSALDLAICARLTSQSAYAASGVRYFQAILDDKEIVGDGAGGDLVVHHDDGYSIRTRGWLGAVVYDWLYDAPGMTPALRTHAMDRFSGWIAWFKVNGHDHDEPISNYYAGYFGAVAFGGLACAGDDPRADGFRAQSQRMWNEEVVPTYRAKLAGGDFPEGWQYGDLVGTLFGLFADANGAIDDLPWLRQIVPLRAWALLPDGVHTYDNGDWSNKPAVAPEHTLFTLTAILPPGDPLRGQAAFLARLARQARPDASDDWKWLQLVADDPAIPAQDPRKPPLSYLSTGTATAFVRSSLAPTSLWVSLTSESTLSTNHQHLDAGHFEVVRGPDAILIDAADYGSYSSLSHNVILVDDPLQSSDWDTSQKKRDVITYKRNQGLSSDTAHMARFEDGGGYVYALADYASAFNPHGWPERRDRAVTRAERELLFSRTPVADLGAASGESGRLVMFDRFTLSDERFTTTFVLHGGPAPQVSGTMARFDAGTSTAWVATLLPKGATSSLVDETHNTYSNDRPFFTNKPPDGMTSVRYEVSSPASSTERRFLHAFVIGARGSSPLPANATPVEIHGAGAEGAVIEDEAYVFAESGPATDAKRIAYTAPRTAVHQVVMDLAPNGHYAIAARADGDGCAVTLAPGGTSSASAQGVLSLTLSDCTVR
ncbi:MAG TPA: hypothetical protein VGI39_13975 [Polyangiaceae bacterium]|jgi:hypothetical protein